MRPLYFVKFIIGNEVHEEVFKHLKDAKEFMQKTIKNTPKVSVIDLRDLNGDILLHYSAKDTDFVRQQL